MNKLLIATAGAVVSGAVAMSAVLFDSSVAASDPGGGSSAMNVVGVSYAQAVAILKQQGVRATFGGSVGSDVPQAQCIVESEKMGTHGRVILMLNCTTKAVEDAQANAPATGAGPGGQPAGPHVGSNGVTTVQATPVGPQPGMTIPGM